MKDKKARDRVTIAAEITTSQREKLDKLSEELDRPLSWIIRDSLNRYFEKNSLAVVTE